MNPAAQACARKEIDAPHPATPSNTSMGQRMHCRQLVAAKPGNQPGDIRRQCLISRRYRAGGAWSHCAPYDRSPAITLTITMPVAWANINCAPRRLCRRDSFCTTCDIRATVTGDCARFRRPSSFRLVLFPPQISGGRTVVCRIAALCRSIGAEDATISLATGDKNVRRERSGAGVEFATYPGMLRRLFRRDGSLHCTINGWWLAERSG